MKGSIRIGGALLLAILVVGGSLYARSNRMSTTADTRTLVAGTSARAYIEPVDVDGDGTPDWEEALSAQVFEAIATPTSTSRTATSSDTYEPPTTFTGKFSEALFQDYLNGKISGEDMSDPDVLVQNAVAAIEQNTKSKTYSPGDVVIVPDSENALQTYGNEISKIMMGFPVSGVNELLVVSESLNTNDPALLDLLKDNRIAYENIIEESLKVEVPTSLTEDHIALLNAYEAIREDIVSMERTFEDPLYSLARVRFFVDNNVAMLRAFVAIRDELNKAKIYYAKDEPGAILYTITL